MIRLVIISDYTKFLQVVWKRLYGKSSRDHGTLNYFRALLNRRTVTSNPKKAVDANIEFIITVVKGHLLAYACELLGITTLDEHVELPQRICHASVKRQWGYICKLASQVVENCALIDITDVVADTKDGVYNYARVLCHYGSMLLEFRDAWAEGDGERIFRCWRLLLPHFKASGRTKYSLEALRIQLQVKALLSPQLAHQVLWDRFVNIKGGEGNNIPCDLYNEHINKLVKKIILGMGPNLTERALQRAARSVSSIYAICKRYDNESGVPVQTTAHSTKPDVIDVSKVVKSVITNHILHVNPSRHHRAFSKIKLNPVWSLEKEKMIEWIDRKKKYFEKMGACTEDELDEEEEESEYSDDDDIDECVEESIAEYSEEDCLLY